MASRSTTNISRSNDDKPSSVAEFLASYKATQKVHVKSLISTFFGDLANPHGGKVWVETIARVLQPLGINNRLVRTSLFRLCEEGWLQSTRSGRNSYYQLTEQAKSQTSLAEKLIYTPAKAEWDGAWTMVFIVVGPVDAQARRELEQELAWIGFGVVAKHVFAHPTVAKEMVAERVERLGLSDQVVCMRAENICDQGIGLNVDDREMAAQCMPIADVETQYQHFVDYFVLLNDYTSEIFNNAESTDLLALRLLLMDEYRRIVLRDPHLPKALLPDEWSGDAAYQCCKAIYARLNSATNDSYRNLVAQSGAQLLKDMALRYLSRFQH